MKLLSLSLRLTCLAALLGGGLAVRAQTTVTSLTASSSNFSTVLSFNTNAALGDTYDAGNSSLDPSKQSGLNGSASNWDMVGNSTNGLLQIASGTFGTGANNAATYFRLRLADYKATGNSGSAIVLVNNGANSFGVGALMAGKDSQVFYVRPAANTTFTAGFTYTAATTLSAGSTNFNYSTVTSVDNNAGSYTKISAGTGEDAYLTFVVLNTDLTAAAGTNFTFSNSTRVTAFTNNNSVLNTQINADYISFNATAGSTSNPLEFGALAVPEPSTWISAGVMLLTGAGLWWRRQRKQG